MTSEDERQKPVIAYLGLGSNLGDRVENLEEAIRRIDLLSGIEVLERSNLYETEPRYVADQPAFINGAISVRTHLDPQLLLEALLGIEISMGRLREIPKGPRNIDIDILLYGDEIVDEEGLTIPHPAMPEREFVLVPLADIAAGVEHPVEGVTIDRMTQDVETKGVSELDA